MDLMQHQAKKLLDATVKYSMNKDKNTGESLDLSFLNNISSHFVVLEVKSYADDCVISVVIRFLNLALVSDPSTLFFNN